MSTLHKIQDATPTQKSHVADHAVTYHGNAGGGTKGGLADDAEGADGELAEYVLERHGMRWSRRAPK